VSPWLFAVGMRTAGIEQDRMLLTTAIYTATAVSLAQ